MTCRERRARFHSRNLHSADKRKHDCSGQRPDNLYAVRNLCCAESEPVRSGISKLIEVLGNTLPKIVEQVFIITHDENLREISSAAVYMLDRDKAASGATVVGELS